MKLHDNSAFWGTVIVPGTYGNYLKSLRFIELAGGVVGLAHFEEDDAGMAFGEFVDECTAYAAATALRSYGQVQEFGFAWGEVSGDGESRELICIEGDGEMVGQVVLRVPLCGFRGL
jgi:hypothetical protein